MLEDFVLYLYSVVAKLLALWNDSVGETAAEMSMIDRQLALKTSAAAAWSDAIAVEREVALARAVEMIDSECASRSMRMSISTPELRPLADLPRRFSDPCVASYWNAARTLAGCLLADESEGAIDLALKILRPALASPPRTGRYKKRTLA
jgi:hypothetical protein